MGFSDRQIRMLSRRVPAKNIKSRTSAGKELSYIEGWYAFAEANRIFGFDGWDRETLDTRCVLAREARGTYSAVYWARVRVTVRTDDRVVVRDGHGTGEASGSSAGEVHDRALKAAETDATKRALTTFGKAFGLNLYSGLAAKAQRLSSDDIDRSAATGATSKFVAASTPLDRADQLLRSSRTSVRNGHAVKNPGEQLGPRADTSESLGPILRARIEASPLALPKLQRVRDKEHLRYVASQPCLLCNAIPSDAHHVRFAQPRAMGRKVGDEFTVPLCRAHHRELHHAGSEAAWWHDMGIEPLEIAEQLWNESERLKNKAPAKPISAK
jgi:hypothetical protein